MYALEVFIGLIGFCQGLYCPKNSTLLQDGYRIWCLWRIEELSTIFEINETCRMFGGRILTIEDQTIQKYLEDQLAPKLQAQNITDNIWINYNASSQTTFDGTIQNYTNWDAGGMDTNASCVTTESPKYKWYSSKCSERHAGVCYKDIDCPTDSIFSIEYDICFWTTRQEKNHSDGQNSCQMSGGTQAVFPNAEVMDVVTENKEVRDAMHEYGSLWIGLNDVDEEGSFKTIDGNEAPYLRWYSTEPNDQKSPSVTEDCVVIEQKTVVEMHDVECSREHVSLCFKWLPGCSCHCQQNATYTQYPDAMAFAQRLENLRREIRIDSKATSAYKKSLVSANDDRPSSQYMGITASLLIISMVGVILLSDAITVLRNVLRYYAGF